jgi:hypothetical protein
MLNQAADLQVACTHIRSQALLARSQAVLDNEQEASNDISLQALTA